MTEAKEKLKQSILQLDDDEIIKNLLMYLMGVQDQKKIDRLKQEQTTTDNELCATLATL